MKKTFTIGKKARVIGTNITGTIFSIYLIKGGNLLIYLDDIKNDPLFCHNYYSNELEPIEDGENDNEH